MATLQPGIAEESRPPEGQSTSRRECRHRSSFPGGCGAPAAQRLAARPTSYPSAQRKRSSYHQDVEEALSSLLWQPYEYRGSNSDTWSSTASSCSSTNSLVSHPAAGGMVGPARSRGAPQACDGVLSSPSGSQWQRAESPDRGDATGVREMRLEVVQAEPSDGSGAAGTPAYHHTPSNVTSVVSANVVGLPIVHARTSSAGKPKSFPEEVKHVSSVSVVPTISCLNASPDGNDVSNVNIVQAIPPAVRTFTSTEAQTDDTSLVPAAAPAAAGSTATREQRRRERRERRHQRRLNATSHPHGQWAAGGIPNDRLPDILNSHMPPPYTSLPSPGSPPAPAVPSSLVPPNQIVASALVPNTMVPFHPGVVAGQVPLVQGSTPVPVSVAAAPTGFRFPFPTAAGFRRSRLGPRYSEEQPKSCCGLLTSRPNSLRWFIALIALVAVCCVLVGTVLGAMRPAGRDHLTVALLMIGVGIVLVTVSGLAWRLTSPDAPSCRGMLGLRSAGSNEATCPRRFVPRLPPSYGRPHHPYAAMMYPEFQYRPPPPSYQASMQEYRLRLLLLDRAASPPTMHAASPPPTYRSHAGSLLRVPLSNRRDASQSEHSCPPSYRSRTSTVARAVTGGHAAHSAEEHHHNVGPHSRDQSVSLSVSGSERDNSSPESKIGAPTVDDHDELRVLPTKDGNLVTIVQTADQNPVIVTVSGAQLATSNSNVASDISTEMEILAHL